MFPYIVPGSVLGITLLIAFNHPSYDAGRFRRHYGHIPGHPEAGIYAAFQLRHSLPDQSLAWRAAISLGDSPSMSFCEGDGENDASGCCVRRHIKLDYPD